MGQSFFPSFRLSLPSYGENYITTVDIPILSYLSFLSEVHQGPGTGYKTLATRPIGVLNPSILYSQLLLQAQLSLRLDLPRVGSAAVRSDQ